MAVTNKRLHIELKFEAEGSASPPSHFRLDEWTTPEKQDSRTVTGWARDGRPEVTTLKTGITRRQLAALIADAADWLSYTGEN